MNFCQIFLGDQNLSRSEVLLVSQDPVHRMKFGGVLHALGGYVDLDYELPYLKLFPYENIMFDAI